jgi:hypothetical protein
LIDLHEVDIDAGTSQKKRKWLVRSFNFTILQTDYIFSTNIASGQTTQWQKRTNKDLQSINIKLRIE